MPTLTDQQITELRELYEQTTPGGYILLPPQPQDGCDHWCVATVDESLIAEVFDCYNFQPPSVTQGFAKHNAEFFAAAHNAMPALLATLDESETYRTAAIAALVYMKTPTSENYSALNLALSKVQQK